MDLNINSRTAFGCKLSGNIEKQIHRQANIADSKIKLNRLLSEKMGNIAEWGSQKSEIVYAKHQITGNYRLGLKTDFGNGIIVRYPIRGLTGKSELAQFLSLTNEKIASTEIEMKNLYKKHGLKFFQKFSV